MLEGAVPLSLLKGLGGCECAGLLASRVYSGPLSRADRRAAFVFTLKQT